MSEPWTVLKVLEWTTGRFARAGVSAARLEAQVLLAHTLACDRVRLYMDFERPLEPGELAQFRQLIQRRLSGQPVAYLVGEQEFWSLAFTVNPEVLIPRPDTEALIELVLDHIADRSQPLRIADIATGSGAIGVTLARELSAAAVVATDLSPAAAAIATGNAERHGLSARVEVRVGDLCAPLAAAPACEPFDVVVSNPPYVRTGDLAGLSPEVRSEPAMALDGGPDGLTLVRRLVTEARAWVVPGGLLAIEHGFDQGDQVRALLDDAGGFEPAATHRDTGQRPRVTWARRARP